jgi:hypothetical protein
METESRDEVFFLGNAGIGSFSVLAAVIGVLCICRGMKGLRAGTAWVILGLLLLASIIVAGYFA